VTPAARFDRTSIAELRAELALSQSVFAKALNVSAETIRGWEQGKRAPDGASLRLLELTRRHPDWLEETITVRNSNRNTD
jgi:putative transcriptional regulator